MAYQITRIHFSYLFEITVFCSFGNGQLTTINGHYRLWDEMDLTAEKVGEPGSVLGPASLVKPYIYNVTAKCTRSTKVLAIDSAGLQEIIRRDLYRGLEVMTELARHYCNRLNSNRNTVTNLFKILKSQIPKSEIFDIYGETE